MDAPGGTAGDDAAASQHLVHQLRGLSAFIGVDEPPLAAAPKPDAGGSPQHGEGRWIVGLLRSASVQHDDFARPLGSQAPSHRIESSGRGPGIATGITAMTALGLLLFDEAIEQTGRHAAASHNHQRAMLDDRILRLLGWGRGVRYCVVERIDAGPSSRPADRRGATGGRPVFAFRQQGDRRLLSQPADGAAAEESGRGC